MRRQCAPSVAHVNVDETQFAQLRSDVTEIKHAVAGNPQWGQPGLVQRTDRLERWREHVDVRVAKVSGAVAVGVSLSAVLLKLILAGHL